MEIPIIYEDDDLVVIDKPAGLVVNRSDSANRDTLQSWIEAEYRFPKVGNSDFFKRAGIVHRLDKDTSGLIIIAKNDESFKLLQQQFFQRIVSKKYQTLVHGKIPQAGSINAPVGRLPWNRRKFGVIPDGRTAETNYKVVSYYKFKNNLYSLLLVTPITGRTHQIRIHLKYLGFPVVGDILYNGKKFIEEDRVFTNRIFLHACYLHFQIPGSYKWLELKSDLPENLLFVLTRLEKINKNVRD